MQLHRVIHDLGQKKRGEGRGGGVSESTFVETCVDLHGLSCRLTGMSKTVTGAGVKGGGEGGEGAFCLG